MVSWFTMIITPILIIMVAIMYVGRRSTRAPRNAPSSYLQTRTIKGGLKDDQRVICCAGASITHGRVSFNWVNLLDSWLNITTSGNPNDGKWQVINAGINGDLAWNLLQRLQPIIDCKPHVITILIGSNDVNATLSDRSANSYRRWKKLPTTPDRAFYRESMIAIIDRLLSSTRAAIGICSLTPLGEHLDTECQQRIVEYNSIIKDIVDKYQSRGRVTYIPIYESLVAILQKKTKHNPSYHHNPQRTALLNFKCLVLHYVMGWSWDAISRHHGMLLLTDCLHINSMAGHIVATCIQQWIETLTIS